MYHYMDMEGDEINLVVSTEIVDVIIGEMLFRPEDELDAVDDDDLAGVSDRNRNIEKLRRSALQLFKLNEKRMATPSALRGSCASSSPSNTCLVACHSGRS